MSQSVIARRGVLAAGGAMIAAPALPQRLRDPVMVLEQRRGGRIGLATFDTGTSRRTMHRGNERFPMCSTFKFLLAAAILARADAGRERLERTIRYTAADIVPNSPVTQARIAEGMTVAALCEATMTLSDNAAANLLLTTIGGPAGLTGFIRTLNDPLTRLDRIEPALNEAAPGDPRDTTTPRAMLGLMREILLGTALSPGSRARILSWMGASRTGLTALRAGVPGDWRAGDKTGAGDHGTRNNLAIFWPPRRAPILVAAFWTGTAAGLEQGNATMAEIGRIVARQA